MNYIYTEMWYTDRNKHMFTALLLFVLLWLYYKILVGSSDEFSQYIFFGVAQLALA